MVEVPATRVTEELGLLVTKWVPVDARPVGLTLVLDVVTVVPTVLKGVVERTRETV